MSKLVDLYVMELTREGATKTIEDVPARLREQVAAAVKKATKAEKAEGSQ